VARFDTDDLSSSLMRTAAGLTVVKIIIQELVP
jgi:hypothetical protein